MSSPTRPLLAPHKRLQRILSLSSAHLTAFVDSSGLVGFPRFLLRMFLYSVALWIALIILVVVSVVLTAAMMMVALVGILVGLGSFFIFGMLLWCCGVIVCAGVVGAMGLAAFGAIGIAGVALGSIMAAATGWGFYAVDCTSTVSDESVGGEPGENRQTT